LLSTDAPRAIARQAASAALDVGKTAVTTVGKKLVDKAVNKLYSYFVCNVCLFMFICSFSFFLFATVKVNKVVQIVSARNG